MATFVRSDLALPFGAEEGFTGCAAPTNPSARGGLPPGPHPCLLLRFSLEELAVSVAAAGLCLCAAGL